MAKRKNYVMEAHDETVVVTLADKVAPPAVIRLEGSVHAIKRNLDVGALYGRGCDDALQHLHRALWELYCSGSRSASSIESYFTKGLEPFVEFLEKRAGALGRDILISDIDRPLIDLYLHTLAITPKKDGSGIIGFATQRSRFSELRSLLSYLALKRIVPPKHELIPACPFPNVAKRTKGEKPLSEGERRALHTALLAELDLIRATASSLTAPQQLTVYLLLIATATGRNTVPLLELGRDAMRPHPLRDDRCLLVTQKRRGGHTHTLSFQADAAPDETITIKSGVVRLFKEVLAATAPLADKVAGALADYLWLYESKGKVCTLNQQALSKHAALIARRHNLTNDDGSPMRITVGSLRKTFVNRLWKLAGGDPLVSARLAGHSVEVSNSHYLTVTPEMERNHKFCGLALVESLQGKAEIAGRKVVEIVPTGVARCSDPKSGRFAPKDGSYCTEFLSCFRCPNQVITGDDLYRLFSFYWLLIKERKFLGATKWGRIYAWVIRDIDNVISLKFPTEQVAKAREAAKLNPHPMWRDRSILVGE